MRLRLKELQDKDNQARKVRTDLPGNANWQDVEGVLHYQSLPYVPEIIKTKLISRYHEDLLVSLFGIEKTRELVARKYYWSTLHRDVKDCVRGWEVYLALKKVCQKPYGDIQSLPVPTHRWKDLLMDFITGLPILTDWKGDSDDSILVIVDLLTKMIYYKLVKVTINTLGLAEVIINVGMRHHGLLDSIVTNRGLLFTSKFWSSLYYFLDIKWRLSTAFHLRIDGQTERQNSTMEAYLQAFVNFEQNNWARLLLIAEFAYNNAKNASTSFTPFELNC